MKSHNLTDKFDICLFHCQYWQSSIWHVPNWAALLQTCNTLTYARITVSVRSAENPQESLRSKTLIMSNVIPFTVYYTFIEND